MEFIADIVSASLAELFERSVIDWLSGDGSPESYNAHMTIASDPGNEVVEVTVCGWVIFLWRINGFWEAYYAMMEERLGLEVA